MIFVIPAGPDVHLDIDIGVGGKYLSREFEVLYQFNER